MLPFIIWLRNINFAIAFSAFSAVQVTMRCAKKLILILICRLLSNNGFPIRIVAFFTESDRLRVFSPL